MVGNRDCAYASASFPLRDRRLGQPGMPGFLVWQLPSTMTDSLDDAAVTTPHQSAEWPHYRK